MWRTPEQIVADRERILARVGGEWTPTAAVDPERDPRRVYADLKWLEDRGLIASQSAKGSKLLFFCIQCRQVMTRVTYGTGCPDGDSHDLRPFYPKTKEWRLSAAGVRALGQRHLQAA